MVCVSGQLAAKTMYISHEMAGWGKLSGGTQLDGLIPIFPTACLVALTC